MTALPRTAVVHLVWRPAGLEPFDAFLRAYAAHEPGAEHELVLVLNGFEDDDALTPYRHRAADLEAREIVLETPSLDLAAYRSAAQRLAHDRVCIVNSYSQPLVAGWLALLEAPLEDHAVGASGASGSYASHLGYQLFQLGVPSRYGDAFPSRRLAREVMHELSGTPLPNPAAHWLYALTMALRMRRGAQRFPAPHLRTNGFVMERALLAELLAAPIDTKSDAYRLESGTASITARLRALGRPPVVVDRHGTARAVADWHRGDVFMQADQSGLLIADNQTRTYAAATPRQRAVLCASAWGPWARPT